jgi:hypothetical protein
VHGHPGDIPGVGSQRAVTLRLSSDGKDGRPAGAGGGSGRRAAGGDAVVVVVVERSLAWFVATATAASATAAPPATASPLTIRAAAINLRRLINLGLHHQPAGWALA